jgi:hypothetical protein
MVHISGAATLPLHWGRAPKYLVVRMQRMAREIVTIILDEYGSDEFLKRISDPFWFQALGCVLGYNWHSSGVTTVLTGILKQAISPSEHGLAVCGGKGRASRKTPMEIGEIAEQFGFSGGDLHTLRYASKMIAKVDSTAIQAGYQLYHHAFFITEDKKWAIVQQGMCSEDRTARRYHWLSSHVRNFVVEPHNAIVGDVKRDFALNMTARESEGCRKASVDLAREEPKRLERLAQCVRPEFQRFLSEWIPEPDEPNFKNYSINNMRMPRNINWKTLREVYEFQPRNYEELLGFKGVGPATVRGLALVAEVIYGQEPSWKDPVKYSFAFGGKDGVPYAVDREALDESIRILRQAVEESKTGHTEKARSLRALTRFVPDSTVRQED